MRRIVSLLLSAGLLLGMVSACQAPAAESDPPETEWTVNGLADLAFSYSGREDMDGLEGLNAEMNPDELAIYIENAYGLEEPWEDAAVIRATGASAFEIAVLRMEDDSAAVRAATALMTYIFTRQGDFAGYAPAEEDMVIHGGIMQNGPFAALFICPDPDGAYKAVSAALSGEHGDSLPEPSGEIYDDVKGLWDFPVDNQGTGDMDPNYPDRCKFTPPNKDDMSIYDTSAILAAWEKGDPTELSSYDRDIYAQAKLVLSEVIKDGMSDYEKELAVYSWVVNNVDYDWTHQNILSKTPRESFTPYGGLVNHTAVCLGYAATFQLLMDLAGVECITVAGAAFSSREDHGWNMVRINGQWYCVDVTWDANVREQLGRGGQEDWDYFNVTSDYMAETNHQWDYANTPEATAEDKGKG